MTYPASQIKTRSCPQCAMCGSGGQFFYRDLRDRLFGAPGRWNIKKCSNPNCGLLWLDPMPIEADLGKAYSDYYTHVDADVPTATPLRRAYRQLKLGYLAGKYGYTRDDISFLFKLLGLVFYIAPGRRASLDASVFHLSAQRDARLLEVGCGNGDAMKRMADLGWDVEGVDFDEKSVRNARSKGLNVYHGDLISQEFGSDIFDAVVMSHVIEHVPNPLQVLQECHRVLKSGGGLVILTPNTASLGHRMYGSNWRGLEPPRHLHLFNMQSLWNLVIAAGFHDIGCRTCVRARKIFLQSHLCANNRPVDFKKKASGSLRLWAVMMETFESVANAYLKDVGEELVLIARKHG